MSKREALLRYNLIIRKLRNSPQSFEQLNQSLEMESDIQGYDFNISKRTFQRDLNDIRSIFNIDIQYDYSDRVYFINDENEPEMSDRILEAFDIFNSMNIKQRLSEFIHFESRKPKGTNSLYGLIHAIKNNYKISFIYQKFSDNKPSVRKVEPYGIKEFKNRWYVLCRDTKDNIIKNFALDRLTGLSISKEKFKIPAEFDIHTFFKDCFGVIIPENKNPRTVVLSFNPLQGKYIKSLPLHLSQEVIKDNKQEFRIRLKIFISHDFIMELLSLGNNVKVIEPPELIEKLKENYEKALENYS